MEEGIYKHLPFYLTGEESRKLKNAIKDFDLDRDVEYFLDKAHDAPLQGDGCDCLTLFEFESGTRQTVKGIILSNTCDISPQNKRDLPPDVTFAPLIDLSAYLRLLQSAGVGQEAIQNKITSIKRQEVTSLFYLPTLEILGKDSVAVLGSVHSMPARHLVRNPNRVTLFSLSNFGFYLFIFKLSIHFCRLQEQVHRSEH